MKRKRIIPLLSLMLLLAMVSCDNSKPKPATPEYLFLNKEQLKPLGIDLDHTGVFYKNMNPSWRKDSLKYCLLAFECTNDNYLNTTLYSEKDMEKARENGDSTMTDAYYTLNDFYPLLIGDKNGNMSFDKYSVLNKEVKLLPVAVCMKEAVLANRADTLIIWFKPTESLKKSLPSDVKIEDYLKVPKVTI